MQWNTSGDLIFCFPTLGLRVLAMPGPGRRCQENERDEALEGKTGAGSTRYTAGLRGSWWRSLAREVSSGPEEAAGTLPQLSPYLWGAALLPSPFWKSDSSAPLTIDR